MSLILVKSGTRGDIRASAELPAGAALPESLCSTAVKEKKPTQTGKHQEETAAGGAAITPPSTRANKADMIVLLFVRGGTLMWR